jgi:hypothetical protein
MLQSWALVTVSLVVHPSPKLCAEPAAATEYYSRRLAAPHVSDSERLAQAWRERGAWPYRARALQACSVQVGIVRLLKGPKPPRRQGSRLTPRQEQAGTRWARLLMAWD